MSSRLTIVRDELLEALPLAENIKTFWLSRYSLIKLILKATFTVGEGEVFFTKPCNREPLKQSHKVLTVFLMHCL